MYLTTKNAGGYCRRPPPVPSNAAHPLSVPTNGLCRCSPGSAAAGLVPRPCPWPLRTQPHPFHRMNSLMSSTISLCPEFDRHELLIYEEVARMPPFRRKTLVLIGAQGVGRRSLKNKLIMWDPDRYGTTVPCEWELGLPGGHQEVGMPWRPGLGPLNGHRHGHHVK